MNKYFKKKLFWREIERQSRARNPCDLPRTPSGSPQRATGGDSTSIPPPLVPAVSSLSSLPSLLSSIWKNIQSRLPFTVSTWPKWIWSTKEQKGFLAPAWKPHASPHGHPSQFLFTRCPGRHRSISASASLLSTWGTRYPCYLVPHLVLRDREDWWLLDNWWLLVVISFSLSYSDYIVKLLGISGDSRVN